MIIFGANPRNKTLGEGEFYCPRCQAQRRYLHRSSRPHFSLYFVPLFPIGKETEYVQCQTCGAAFEPAVLRNRPPEPLPDLAALLNTIQRRLEAGSPVEYLLRDLTAAGLNYDVARANIEAGLGPQRRRCESCGLTYAPVVAVCSECQAPLEPAR